MYSHQTQRVARTMLVIMLAVFVAMASSSCSLFGGKKKKTVKRPKTVARPPAFEFKFALERGATYQTSLFLDESVNISQQGEEGDDEYFTAPPPLRFDLAMTWAVEELDKENKDKQDQYSVKIRVDDITLVTDDLDMEAVAEVLPRFMGQTMTLVVSREGEVLDYYALELDTLYSLLEEEFAKDQAKLAVVQEVKKELSWDRMKERLELAFHFVPPVEEKDKGKDKKSKRKKVAKALKKVDDTWDAPGMGYTVSDDAYTSIELKYKFAELKKESGASLANLLFGMKQDMYYPMGEEKIAGYIARGKRIKESSGTYEKLEMKGYVVYNTTEKDIEEIKSEMTATGNITLQPRRGGPVTGQLTLTRNMVLSLAQEQEE